ncbi:olfactory receptor 2D2-like [Ambystoma mexicanum]|uniref:olfactory receptor 2D2-like n=1 Tax=Ambystoma mexicanum TaxID=8296 RepID=UPI0037E9B4F6
MEKWNGSSVTEFLLLGLSEDPHVNIILFVLFLCTYLFTIIGNVSLITACVIEPRLHTPMYFFLGNLSILDIFFSTVHEPLILAQLLSRTTISFSGCAAQMYTYLLLGITECELLAVMAYDRYAAILFPLRYSVIMSRSICVKMVVCCWIIGGLLGLIDTVFALQLPLCGRNIINHFCCEATSLLQMSCGDTFFTEMVIFSVAIFALLIPTFFTLVSYVRIITTIMKIRSSEGRRKVFSTCASHLIVVISFYGTAIFMYMKPKSIDTINQDKIISLFYTVIPPLLNPVIYSLRNKDVKVALLKVTKRSNFC